MYQIPLAIDIGQQEICKCRGLFHLTQPCAPPSSDTPAMDPTIDNSISPFQNLEVVHWPISKPGGSSMPTPSTHPCCRRCWKFPFGDVARMKASTAIGYGQNLGQFEAPPLHADSWQPLVLSSLHLKENTETRSCPRPAW